MALPQDINLGVPARGPQGPAGTFDDSKLAEYATKAYVNELKNRTNNVLQATDPLIVYQGDEHISADSWTIGSRGNGTAEIGNLDKSFSAKHYFKILNNTTNAYRDFSQRPIGWTNANYYCSIYARIDPDAATDITSINAYIRSYSKQTGEVFRQNFEVTSREWQRFTFNIDARKFYTDETASFAFGLFSEGSIDFAEPFLSTNHAEWFFNAKDLDAQYVRKSEMPDLSSYATQNWVTNAISSSGLNVFTKNAPSKNEIDSFHSEIDFIMNTRENTLPTQHWGTLITIRGVALEDSGTQFWLSDNGTFYVRAKQNNTLEWQGWHPLGAGGMTRQEIIDLINTEEW